MKLVVGLGNPGEKYTKTRHNIGFVVADKLADRLGFAWTKDTKSESLIIIKKPQAIFLKPQVFMNETGKSVGKVVNFYKLNIPNIWVIHDDLDIKLGEFKIQQGKGPKLHNGVNSIEKQLGRDDFWRIRVGVDNREVGSRTPGDEYVLQSFTNEELEVINGVIENVAQELIKLISQ